MENQDHYAVLGVAPDAPAAAIKQAYRRLAHRYHPDRAGSAAADQFRRIAAAYRALMQAEGRRADEQVLWVSLEDLHWGEAVTVQLPARGNRKRTLRARLPRGVTDGRRLRLCQGCEDVTLVIRVRPHPLLRAVGHDLYVDLQLSPWEVNLGTAVDVPTLNGPVRIHIEPGTRAGQVLRVAAHGLPKANGHCGDLFAVVCIAGWAERARGRPQQVGGVDLHC